MFKIGLVILFVINSLYASAPNVDSNPGLQEAVEKQKRLHDRYQRTQRPVEKAHAFKVYNEYVAKIKATYGESATSLQD